jgi:beta-galactosidase
LTNRYDFTDLSTVARLQWQLWTSDGPLRTGEQDLPAIAPGASKTIQLAGLAAALGQAQTDHEVWLDVQLVAKSATEFIHAGHELAYEQFKLGGDWAPTAVPAKTNDLSIEQHDGRAIVSGAGWEMHFSQTARGLSAWTARGESLIESGPLPDFWRAPTDNDRGAGLTDPDNQRKHLPKSSVWESALATWQPTMSVSEKSDQVTVRFAGSLLDGKAHQALSYTIFPSGVMEVDFAYDASEELPQMIRVGTQWRLPLEYDQLDWYGRGPEPTYSDRNEARVGIYATDLMSDWVDYSRPQENGNKVDTRWLKVTDAHGNGLLFEGGEPLSVNMLPWDAGTIQSADYTWQLPVPEAVFLNIDLAQIGVGGDSSWGAIAHEPYLLKEKTYSYRYRVTPIRP